MFWGLYCALVKTAVRSDSERVEQPGIVTMLPKTGISRLTVIAVGEPLRT